MKIDIKKKKIAFFTKLDPELIKKCRIKKKKEKLTWQQVIEGGMRVYLDYK